MDRTEIVQKVASQLSAHPNAALPIIAERLGTTEREIEDALQEMEGLSFQEFRTNSRLEQAFKQLGELSIAANGPWEIVRARRRLAIPKATVRYKILSFWGRKGDYSGPCPLVDISKDGLALLADQDANPMKLLSLILKLPGEEETLEIKGRVVYAVATGIAGFRYRIGVRFLPFSEKRSCNPVKALDALTRIEETYTP
ncbi:MAG: PilZ domain-containing protein [Acidobacteria bacterium]|nr:PilZ domain-containing protein [Acidobacteriota bacterium]